ncbi:hypothetical protein E4U33_003687 [Claviceps sp. LM78 group G4]|nr:hypothetical protein E4U33_003687 [Claviceps sp. LM78 group G4]
MEDCGLTSVLELNHRLHPSSPSRLLRNALQTPLLAIAVNLLQTRNILGPVFEADSSATDRAGRLCSRASPSSITACPFRTSQFPPWNRRSHSLVFCAPKSSLLQPRR